jgi:hypothetical protein
MYTESFCDIIGNTHRGEGSGLKFNELPVEVKADVVRSFKQHGDEQIMKRGLNRLLPIVYILKTLENNDYDYTVETDKYGCIYWNISRNGE